LHGVVLVGWTEEEVDVDVEFVVPFRADEVWVAPWRRVWEFEEVLVMVAFVPLLTIVASTPKMVVDPKVVVRVIEPLVRVERIGDVVIAEEVETVMVDP
jgi:hypothetical protein